MGSSIAMGALLQRPHVYSQSTVNTGVLPSLAPIADTTHWVIDVGNMTGDLSLTGWLPTGIVAGARITIRKTDTSPFRVVFSDGVSNYAFVDRQSEYLVLLWNGSSFHV